MTVFVYILECADKSFYTGITRRSVEERVGEHQSGLIKGYTQSRLPVELVYSEAFERLDEAIATERRIKGWNRAKKQALIDGDYKRLVRLSAIRASDLILREPQDEVRGREPQDEVQSRKPMHEVQSRAPHPEALEG